MSSKSAPAERFSLRRWSQRKLEAARAEVQAPQAPAPPVDLAATGQPPVGRSRGPLEPADLTSVSNLSVDAHLPAIESLTIDSDYAPFFKPQVDESLKRAALKQLFRDPRFNIMDGLDTYVGDYTQPDPIPPAMLEELMQRRVSFPLSVPEADAAERAADGPAGDRVAPSAEAIAPPVAAVAADAQIAPVALVAPVAPSDAAIPDAIKDAPETDAGTKSGKS